MAVSGGSRKCPPGCDCKRHNPTHRIGCMCPRHRPKAPEPPKPVTLQEFRARKNANPRSCWCGHYDIYHDNFGCRSCESQGKKCRDFRPKTGPKEGSAKSYETEIAREGFVQHNGELATCSTCWMTVKLGVGHTLTALIAARAHNQSYHGKSKDTTRPDRAG